MRVLGSDPLPAPMGNEGLDYACSRSCLKEEKSPGTQRKDDFCGQKSQNLAFNDSTSLPLFLHTATQHWEKIEKLRRYIYTVLCIRFERSSSL